MNWKFYKYQYDNFLHSERRKGGLWALWLVVVSLVPILAYALLGVLKFLPSDGQMPRYLFIMIGMTLWLLLSDALMRPANSITQYKGYFIRQEINIFTLLTAWFPARVLALVVQILLCLSFVAYEAEISVTSLAVFMLIMIFGFVLFHMFGLVAAIVSLMYPNFNTIITTINRFMLFVSGVIFPIPDGEIARYLELINPYYVFIDGARSSLIGAEVEMSTVYLWLIVSVILGMTLVYVLPKISPSIREFLQ